MVAHKSALCTRHGFERTGDCLSGLPSWLWTVCVSKSQPLRLAIRGNSSEYLNVTWLVAGDTDAPSLMKAYHY